MKIKQNPTKTVRSLVPEAEYRATFSATRRITIGDLIEELIVKNLKRRR